MTFNVFYVINSWCQWIVNVNDDDLPICLFFIKQRHNTEDFDLLDLTRSRHKLANLTDIERIIVSFGFGFGVNDVWVFPGLDFEYQPMKGHRLMGEISYLGKATIIPEVAFVRKAIANVAKLALLDVLFDRVQWFFFGNLYGHQRSTELLW